MGGECSVIGIPINELLESSSHAQITTVVEVSPSCWTTSLVPRPHPTRGCGLGTRLLDYHPVIIPLYHLVSQANNVFLQNSRPQSEGSLPQAILEIYQGE